MKPFRSVIRVISFCLLLSFSGEQLLLADPEFLARKVDELFAPKLSLNFKIPESIATVEDSWSVQDSSKTIYLLQDAHTNESGQINLSKTLERLLKEDKDLKYIFVEAGQGNDSLSFLRDKVSLKKRTQVAKDYLKKGLLHGEEYLDLTSDHNFIVWGVEDFALYQKAIEAYRDVKKDRAQFQDYLLRIQSTLNILKPRILNSNLLAFDKKHTQYLKEETPLSEYLQTLTEESQKRNINLLNFPHLKALNNLKDKEAQIDFKKANEEQQIAIQSLAKEDQEELLEYSSQKSPSKLKSQDPRAFYTLLEERIKKQSDYPDLSKYFSYLKESNAINPKEIQREQRQLETALFDALAHTQEERVLLHCQSTLRILQKLFDLKLTPEEYKEYKEDAKTFTLSHLAGFINKKIMDLENLYDRAAFLEEGYDTLLKNSETFYELTQTRDQAFLKGLTDKMNQEHQNKAVLITGGFHAPNLKRLFKDQNISFVSITPQVYQETNQKRYEELLLNQKIDARSLTPASTYSPNMARLAAVMNNPSLESHLTADLGVGAWQAARRVAEKEGDLLRAGGTPLDSGARLAGGDVSENLLRSLISWKQAKGGQPVVLAFLGEPGSGKSTLMTEFKLQANRILDRIDPEKKAGRVVSVSGGDIFRGVGKIIAHWNKEGRQKPVPEELGDFVPYAELVNESELEIMNQGGIIPFRAAMAVVSKVFETEECRNALVLMFDGFPRTLEQLSAFENGTISLDERSVTIDSYVVLRVDPNQREDILSDIVAQREDRPDTKFARERLGTYEHETKPVVDQVLRKANAIAIPARNSGVSGEESKALVRQAFLDGIRTLSESVLGESRLETNPALRGLLSFKEEYQDADPEDPAIGLLRDYVGRSLESVAGKIQSGKIDPFYEVALLTNSSTPHKQNLKSADRELTIGFFPLAADPPQYGHAGPMTFAVDQLNLDMVIFRVQGLIDYKGTPEEHGVPAAKRFEMTKAMIDPYYPLFRMTDIGINDNSRGEWAAQEFLRMNPNTKIHLVYILGSDSQERTIERIRALHEFTKKAGLNPNHRITIAFTLRGPYGKTLTEEILNQLIRKNHADDILNGGVIQSPFTDINWGSTDVRQNDDFRFVPRAVRAIAERDGLYGLGAIRQGARLASLLPVDFKIDPEKYTSPIQAGRPMTFIFQPFYQQVSESIDFMGLGDFGTAIQYVDLNDKLAGEGPKIGTQLLPFKKSKAFDSPYSEESDLIDPRFVSIALLIKRLRERIPSMDFSELGEYFSGKLRRMEAARRKNLNEHTIDHGEITKLKDEVLRIIWNSLQEMKGSDREAFFKEFEDFKQENADWLPDQALFSALVKANILRDPAKGWDSRSWEPALSRHEAEAVQNAMKTHRDEVEFISFVEFVAQGQLKDLIAYADSKGQKLAVDIPYAPNAAIVWMRPELMLDASIVTQSVPPEAAYPAGQRWQFVLFDYKKPETMEYLVDRLRRVMRFAPYVRLDHDLGYIRNYESTEDTQGQLTLSELGIYDEIIGIERKAHEDMFDFISDVDSEKHFQTEKGEEVVILEDVQMDEIKKIMASAAKEALALMIRRLSDLKGGHPALAPGAIDLTFDENGNLRQDAMIVVGRGIPQEDHGKDMPKGSGWGKFFSVAKAVASAEHNPMWREIRLTPSSGANDNGFMLEYLFGEEEPQADDSLRPNYFRLVEKSDELHAEFVRVAQELGGVLIAETLGVVPVEVQNSRQAVESYSPAIWGLDPSSPFYRKKVLRRSARTFDLHDSTLPKARWEKELSGEERRAFLSDVWPDLKPDHPDYPRHLNTLTEEVNELLLAEAFLADSLIVLPTWPALLMLTEDFRLNSPGTQMAQWSKAPPVTVEDLIRAAEGHSADERAVRAVALFRRLQKKREEKFTRKPGQAFLGSHPDVESGRILMTKIPAGGLPAKPFIVEAFVDSTARTATVVLVDENGQEIARHPMQSASAAGLEGVTRFEARLTPTEAGRYRYYFEIQKSDGAVEKSAVGNLIAFNEGDMSNSLSPNYFLKQWPDLLEPWQAVARLSSSDAGGSALMGVAGRVEGVTAPAGKEALPKIISPAAVLNVQDPGGEAWLKGQGFDIISKGNIQTIAYSEAYQPLKPTYDLLMIPHGATPANKSHLFAGHQDGDERVLPTQESLGEVRKGAKEFAQQYAEDIRRHPDKYVFLRSPLQRTEMTAGVYREVLKEDYDIDIAVTVDPAVIEINQRDWHLLGLNDLPEDQKEIGERYRDGDFFTPAGGAESRADLMRRAYDWLVQNQDRYAGKTVVVFGHGHFQNAVETLLRTYPEKTPEQIYARGSASHLRRGYIHPIYQTGARLAKGAVATDGQPEESLLQLIERIYEGTLNEYEDEYLFPGFKEHRDTEDTQGNIVGVYHPTPIRDGLSLLKAAGVKEGSHFIDAGGGDGRMAAIASLLLGADATSVEVDPRLGDYASERLRDIPTSINTDGIHLVPGRIENEHFSDADVVYYAFNEIAHWEAVDDVSLSPEGNFRHAEKQFAEQLKPGAVVILTFAGEDVGFEDPRLEAFRPKIDALENNNLLRPKFYRKKAGARLAARVATQSGEGSGGKGEGKITFHPSPFTSGADAIDRAKRLGARLASSEKASFETIQTPQDRFFLNLGARLPEGKTKRVPVMEDNLRDLRIYAVTRKKGDILLAVNEATGEQFRYDVSKRRLVALQEEERTNDLESLVEEGKAQDITEAVVKFKKSNQVPSVLKRPVATGVNRVVLMDLIPSATEETYRSLIKYFKETLGRDSRVLFVSKNIAKAQHIASLAFNAEDPDNQSFKAATMNDLKELLGNNGQVSYLLEESYLEDAQNHYGPNNNFLCLQSLSREERGQGWVGDYAWAPIGALMDSWAAEDWDSAAAIYNQMTGNGLSPNSLEFQIKMVGMLTVPFVSKLTTHLADQIYLADIQGRMA